MNKGLYVVMSAVEEHEWINSSWDTNGEAEQMVAWLDSVDGGKVHWVEPLFMLQVTFRDKKPENHL